MREILWFRRDLRVDDNAILALAKDEVLPIFIFDTNILDTLPKEDKRVFFIFKSVMALKEKLKNLGLDLAIFYGKPQEVFLTLKEQKFDQVLCSIDFDEYAIKRDKEIEQILPMHRVLDSFILNPIEHLKKDGTPYKVFTPFYNSVKPIWESTRIKEYERNPHLKLVDYAFENEITLETLGFAKYPLPSFLTKSANELLDELLDELETKICSYKIQRDFFCMDATSNLSVHLRFGLISPKQVFNRVQTFHSYEDKTFFIRELFWREFYNYILFHFPKSEFENFNGLEISWKNDETVFQKWCEGQTGVPIIDAAMQHFNRTGTMHNRLRMIVASYATKNLLIPWKKAENYFALKLLDYEVSSNVGSWQWAASTGADSVPYFRIFNPYIQSKKFDKEGIFIKQVLPQLREIDAKYFHMEEGLSQQFFVDYPKPLVSIEFSRKRAIQSYKDLKIAKD